MHSSGKPRLALRSHATAAYGRLSRLLLAFLAVAAICATASLLLQARSAQLWPSPSAQPAGARELHLISDAFVRQHHISQPSSSKGSSSDAQPMAAGKAQLNSAQTPQQVGQQAATQHLGPHPPAQAELTAAQQDAAVLPTQPQPRSQAEDTATQADFGTRSSSSTSASTIGSTTADDTVVVPVINSAKAGGGDSGSSNNADVSSSKPQPEPPGSGDSGPSRSTGGTSSATDTPAASAADVPAGVTAAGGAVSAAQHISTAEGVLEHAHADVSVSASPMVVDTADASASSETNNNGSLVGPVPFKYPIWWHSPMWSGSGYGSEGINYVLSMLRSGLVAPRDLYAYNHGDNWQEHVVASMDPTDRAELELLQSQPAQQSAERRAAIVVCHSLPTNWAFPEPMWFSGAPCPPNPREFGWVYAIGRTMFETDKLPAVFVPRCNAMNEIWVPSEWSRQSFIASGVEPSKLVVVPEGVNTTHLDPDLFTPLDLAAVGELVFGTPKSTAAMYREAQAAEAARKAATRTQLEAQRRAGQQEQAPVPASAVQVQPPPVPASAVQADPPPQAGAAKQLITQPAGDQAVVLPAASLGTQQTQKQQHMGTRRKGGRALLEDPDTGHGMDSSAADAPQQDTEGIHSLEAAERPFVFISSFKWESRKGWDVLLEAYLSEFSASDNVELYILTKPFMGSGNGFKDKMRSWADSKFAALQAQEQAARAAAEATAAALAAAAQAARAAAAGVNGTLPGASAAGSAGITGGSSSSRLLQDSAAAAVLSGASRGLADTGIHNAQQALQVQQMQAQLQLQLQQQAAKQAEPWQKYPTLYVVSRHISDEDFPRFYKAGDAFVLPSRGEGWGRPHVEAMSMGLPVISTNWSGITAYLDETVGYPIHIEDLVPVQDLSESAWWFRGLKWAQPSVSHLRTLMRQVYTDRAEAARKGAAARQRMIERYSPQVLAQRLVAEFRRIEAAVDAVGPE